MADYEAFGQRSGANEMAESSRDAPKQGELHQDVEDGMDVANIDRIERVYK